MKTFTQGLAKNLKKAYKKTKKSSKKTKKGLIKFCNESGHGLVVATRNVGREFRMFGYNFMHPPSKHKDF